MNEAFEAHLGAARELAKRQKWKLAIEQINGALRIDPTSKVAHLTHLAIIEQVPDLHVMEYGSGWLSRARKSGDALVFVYPDDPEAHEASARAYLLDKNWGAATEAAEAALKIDPNRPEAQRIIELAHSKVAKKISRMSKTKRFGRRSSPFR